LNVTRTNRWLSAILVAASSAAVGAPPAVAQTQDLTTLSLQDLLNTEITSVAMKEQSLSRTAAAVYVISQEDIRRSGATTLPDLLRMVPGFTVGAIDATRWAVSSRGFHGVYANKLLVLIDGRSVYSPMFGGVHWEMQNVPLDDIDRIEVVRGPGGTLWGANAVNGVVNIITKPADATAGGLASVGAGSQQRGASDVRYGGTIGDAHYRAFAKYSNRSTGGSFMDFENPDGADVGLGGLRIDWRGQTDVVSVLGAVQDGHSNHVELKPTLASPLGGLGRTPVDFTDGHTVFSWTRSASSRSERGVQASYQAYRRAQGALQEHWQIVDVDARQRLALGTRHEVVAGAGYRDAWTRIANGNLIAFWPDHEHLRLVTGFVQDEIEIARGVRITPGSKFEHNTRTGVEAQPGVRMTWAPTRMQAFWGAVTRAVRTPSRADRSVSMVYSTIQGVAPLPMVIMVKGNPEYGSEDLRALELGYRRQAQAASFDVAVFRNDYSGIRGEMVQGIQPGLFEGQPVLVNTTSFENRRHVNTEGVEVSATWRPVQWWKVSGGHSWQRLTDPLPSAEDPAPAHTFHVRSYVDLPGNVEASALFYRVSAYRVSGAAAIAIPGYAKLDANLAWRPASRLGLNLGVQNLLHGGEIEGADVLLATGSVPVRTAVVGTASWRF
jgi:iron complex outermembrane recepter protein